MPPAEKTTDHRYGVLAMALLVCVLSSLFMMPFLPDDSYISFRYAENIVRGHGITFNPGEPPVEGYSNFLWILLCAALHTGGLDLPSFMPYVGILLAMLSVYVLWTMLVRRGLPAVQTIFALLLLATSGPFIAYAISGMEMPLYGLLMLLLVNGLDRLFSKGQMADYVMFGIFGVLLGMCRPEGIVVFPAAVALMLWWTRKPPESPTLFHKTRRKGLIVASAVFVIVVAVYNAWRINYFGEMFPTPFMSKGGVGLTFFTAWRRNFTDYFVAHGGVNAPLGYYVAVLTVLAVIGWRLSRSRAAHRNTETLALGLSLVHIAVYLNFHDWMPAMRYHAGIIGTLLLTAVHVPTPLFVGGKEKGRLEGKTRRRFILGGVAVVLVSWSVLCTIRVTTVRIEEANQKCGVALGKWLREVMPPRSLLAISDVGAIPYYSGFNTIDIHPESLTDLNIAKNGFSVPYFYERRPDVVLFPSRGQFVKKFMPQHYEVAADPRFDRMYRHLGTARFDWFLDRSYWIFIPINYPRVSDDLMDRFPHGIGTVANKRN